MTIEEIVKRHPLPWVRIPEYGMQDANGKKVESEAALGAWDAMTNAFLAQHAKPESRERPEWLKNYETPFHHDSGCVMDAKSRMVAQGMLASVGIGLAALNENGASNG